MMKIKFFDRPNSEQQLDFKKDDLPTASNKQHLKYDFHNALLTS